MFMKTKDRCAKTIKNEPEFDALGGYGRVRNPFKIKEHVLHGKKRTGNWAYRPGVDFNFLMWLSLVARFGIELAHFRVLPHPLLRSTLSGRERAGITNSRLLRPSPMRKGWPVRAGRGKSTMRPEKSNLAELANGCTWPRVGDHGRLDGLSNFHRLKEKAGHA